MNPQPEVLAYRELLSNAEQALAGAGVSTPRLDAEVMLAAAMQRDRAGLYTRLGDTVDGEVLNRFRHMLRRRTERQPIAYITGTREFWSLPFIVTPDVLVPRPETELVVQAACELLATHRDPVVCDVGTGSGCIAIALARELPRARIVATDLSPVALQIARRNAIRHGVESRIRLVCADLFGGVSGRIDFDLVVSNPPYVAADVPLMEETSFEPRGALLAGASGLEVIRRLLDAVPLRLRAGAHFVMELGNGQADAVWQMALASGLSPVEIRRDLAGIPRALLARRRGEANG
jgi:release factor glutamine methyltransferase